MIGEILLLFILFLYYLYNYSIILNNFNYIYCIEFIYKIAFVFKQFNSVHINN